MKMMMLFLQVPHELFAVTHYTEMAESEHCVVLIFNLKLEKNQILMCNQPSKFCSLHNRCDYFIIAEWGKRLGRNN